MIKLFNEQNISLTKLAKEINTPKLKLYNYANGKFKIENMPIKLILDIAYYFHIEVNELYNKMIEYKK